MIKCTAPFVMESSSSRSTNPFLVYATSPTREIPKFPQKTVARGRRDRLLSKEMGQQKAIGYDLLAELGQLERMTAIIGEDTPWSRLFEMTFAPQYRLITVEFLSTFVFTLRAADQPQADQLQPELTMQSSVLGGLGSATSRLSELPGSRVYVTRSFVICTGSLPRLFLDVGKAKSGACPRIYLFILYIEPETVQCCTVSGGVL
ncbi:hypothetical protein R6Q57_016377 [Mikania cordata]